MTEEESRLALAKALDGLKQGWTFSTIKDYFDNILDQMDKRYQQRFDDQQKAITEKDAAAEKNVSAAITAADRAVTKAEAAAEKRFEAVNEFRNTLSDQALTFVTRIEADAKIETLRQRFDDIKSTLDTGKGGSATHLVATGMAISITSAVIALVGIFVSMNHSSQGTGATNVQPPALIQTGKS